MAGGQGVLGLQRAFHKTGVATVVASLWDVDDAATALLMEEFYANLWRDKLSPLRALRRAQLTVLNQPERVLERRLELVAASDPRGLSGRTEPLPPGRPPTRRSPPAWWAGFVLSGDMESDNH